MGKEEVSVENGVSVAIMACLPKIVLSRYFSFMQISTLSSEIAESLPFERVSFSHQFLIVGSVGLGIAMTIVGIWLGAETERAAVNRVTAVSAAYVESILAAQLRAVPEDALTTQAMHDALDHIFISGVLQRKIAAFKLWDAQGVVHYSSDDSLIGQRFPVDETLASAFSGTVQARIVAREQELATGGQDAGQRLLEIYVPIRISQSDKVVAVATFNHWTGNIDREISSSKLRSWALVAGVTLSIYLLLFGMVRRANGTILRQRDDLRSQLLRLSRGYEELEHMRRRLGEAGSATTALNEQFLQRVAADLHDGPAQTLAFSLMRFDELVTALSAGSGAKETSAPDVFRVREALRSSLEELRGIATGLGVAGIADLSLAETVDRAVRDFELQYGRTVEAHVESVGVETDLAVRITAYRIVQESLTNCGKHALAGALCVHVQQIAGYLNIEVADQGQGFDLHATPLNGRLGLAFMKERVRLLGGTFVLESTPGCGTRVAVKLPLTIKESIVV